jgi:hypothetical protein
MKTQYGLSYTYGVLPSKEEFDAQFDVAVGHGNTFSFGNDKRIGNDHLTCDELWIELKQAVEEFEGTAVLPIQKQNDAGNWASVVLFCLNIEWI